MSDNLSFIFDRTLIRKTVRHIDKSNNSSQCVLGFNITVGSWLIGPMNMFTLTTSYGMALDASVIAKKWNKRLCLIRLEVREIVFMILYS
jgi:hypothetical protein